jgi:hypothetical protein
MAWFRWPLSRNPRGEIEWRLLAGNRRPRTGQRRSEHPTAARAAIGARRGSVPALLSASY